MALVVLRATSGQGLRDQGEPCAPATKCRQKRPGDGADAGHLEQPSG